MKFDLILKDWLINFIFLFRNKSSNAEKSQLKLQQWEAWPKRREFTSKLRC